jgi:hypothetical protein
MKLQKPRTRVIVIGLGTALLLAGQVRAESERQSSASAVNSGTQAAEDILVASAGSKFDAKSAGPQDATQLSAAGINGVAEEEAGAAGFPMEARLPMLLFVVGTVSIFLDARLVAFWRATSDTIPNTTASFCSISRGAEQS